MQTLESLVTQAKSRQLDQSDRHAAFGRLVEHFQRMAIASAFAVLQDPQLAQDVTQEAFITAYQKLDQLREPKAFPSWLHRIVLTQCNRQKRGKQIITAPIQGDEDIPVIDLDPAIQLEQGELREKILNAIERLPDHERIVVNLFYLQEYSIKEIAHQLNLPVTTIKKRLQYARRRLRHTVASIHRLTMMACYPGGGSTLYQLLEAILIQLPVQQIKQPVPMKNYSSML